MSGGWVDDDDLQEQKLDLRLWKTLLRYTLHYRGTSIAFVVVAFALAGLCATPGAPSTALAQRTCRP